jgi:hypothetical protein
MWSWNRLVLEPWNNSRYHINLHETSAQDHPHRDEHVNAAGWLWWHHAYMQPSMCETIILQLMMDRIQWKPTESGCTAAGSTKQCYFWHLALSGLLARVWCETFIFLKFGSSFLRSGISHIDGCKVCSHTVIVAILIFISSDHAKPKTSILCSAKVHGRILPPVHISFPRAPQYADAVSMYCGQSATLL